MVRRSPSVVALAAASLLVAGCATAPLPTASPATTPATSASLPTATATAIESPRPTRPPTPSPSPLPTPPPAQPYVFSTSEFVAAFDTGALDGKTVLVDGSIPEIGNGTSCSPPPPAFRCALGVLAGTDLPDHVWYERWAVKENEGAHFEGGDVTWPWWGGPDWPVDGILAFRVTEEGKIQFVGRQRRLVQSVPDAKGLDINSIDPEEVVLVDGWLTGFGGILDCAPSPPDTVAGLPERWCSNSGYLMDSARRDVSTEADRAAGIELQHNAYWDYVPDPKPELAQMGDGEPRFGTYALSPRLEGWCARSAAPCWQWNLVGRVDDDPNLTARERVDGYWFDFDQVDCMGMTNLNSLEDVIGLADLIVTGRPIGTEPWRDSPYATVHTLINFEVDEVLKGTLPDDSSNVVQVNVDDVPPTDVSDLEHLLLLSRVDLRPNVYYATAGYESIYANVDGRVVTPEFAPIKAEYGSKFIFSVALDGMRFDKLLERVHDSAASNAQLSWESPERVYFAC
jgi:hypothetical protein